MQPTARILVTGPVNDLESYLAAAREAGWEALAFPLLGVEQLRVDLAETLEPDPPDWLCLTSSNALPALSDLLNLHPVCADLPCAVVGERSAERLKSLGFNAVRVGGRDAGDLARRLLEHLQKGDRVLWPRGDRSRQLGDDLRSAGIVVEDPVVYRAVILPQPAPPPAAAAVFFASPSAVDAWGRLDSHAADIVAIAIGDTTSRALLGGAAPQVRRTLCLTEPTPQALGRCLRELANPSPHS